MSTIIMTAFLLRYKCSGEITNYKSQMHRQKPSVTRFERAEMRLQETNALKYS